MKIIDNAHFELSTGRIIYAYDLRFGMNDELELTYGYDGRIEPDPSHDDHKDDHGYTPSEAIEIADYMIDLWGKFRAAQQMREPDDWQAAQ